MITKRTLSGIRRASRGALAGLLAAAAALGVAELVAGITGPLSSPVLAVGSAAIDLTPTPVKDFAIAHFGSDDKVALEAGIIVLLVVFAALTGTLALGRLAAGLTGLAMFGALGVSAALTRPASGPADALPSLAGTAAAAGALVVLIRAARGPRAAPRARDAETARPARRRFLAMAGVTALAAAATGGAGDLLLRRFSAAAARSAVRLPGAAAPAPPVPAGAELKVAGLTSYFTPPGHFYRVDTDLLVPQVSPEQWTLRITGMVDREIELTFAELLRLPLTEHDMTLVCVSNEVGGPYAGNARWLGASLPALLRRAGVRRGADQVLSTSTDGMTISTALDTVMDGRQALVAVGMNGQPLPLEHGFPARMVVPGLYGYVSATKWVTSLNLTTFARQRAYWTQRGYAAQAPIKTESRIDVPRPLARLDAGPVTVAGVAWAPHRGISAVEVQADGGPWHAATLAAAAGTDTWRQWKWAWDAPPGLHTLQVRAADGTGAMQTSQRAGVFPSGATGWDSVVVTVSLPSPSPPRITSTMTQGVTMKNYRNLAVSVAVTGLVLGAAACSSTSSGGSGASGGSASSSASPSMAPSSGSAMPSGSGSSSMANFGPACSSVPKTGAGSFNGMSTAPVATAASANPVLSTLVSAVKKAGLVDTLNSAKGITVFAPDNSAFAKIPSSTMSKVMASKTELSKILTYHVASGTITPSQFASGKPVKTLEGGTVKLSRNGGTYKANGASVVCGNVHTANATVYIINSVLMPSSS